ncbi:MULTISPECIES: 3-hydroxyacyl-CoA dehydrogenase NAD-binding domain-containing protein [unclassified Sphingobium]|uniref:3-hydroxyacyl-CoA dehydrogenase NAD-binding domain-containing protein n=1 Tax=unclassified Sphingobium TaxID=2611147 RepID=UPI0035A72C60
MSGVGTYTIEDGIGLITIDSPPVNALSHRVRVALDEGFRKFAHDPEVKGIILICAGRTFIAGADITELGKPILEPTLREVVDLIEQGSKPVVAAIHGTALGGGYEMALICHYRVAVPSAMVGLPEVKLGLLPGGGGTQRLPRLVGPEIALDVILKGDPVPAPEALRLGMIDGLAEEGKLKEGALAFIRKILAEGKPLQRVRDRTDKTAPHRGNSRVFDEYRRNNAKAMRGFLAPENNIKAIEAAVELSFDDGIRREQELFKELLESPQSAAQRYYFFAEREAAKIPDVPGDTPVRPVKSVGVIGAGTMGGGITMTFLNAGIPVILSDISQDNVDRGIATIRSLYESSAKRGKLTQDAVERRMALVSGAVGIEPLKDVDLVVEAVFEQMALKQEIFAKLDGVVRPDAILASNTSFLSIDEIAGATANPGRVVGLHSFSPANVMRLLEVVRGAATDKDVIATAMKLAKTLRKVPVLSRVGPGFIANRVMGPRTQRAEAIVLEGTGPELIDQALYDFGFPMGPFQMLDLAGLDVAGRDSTERTLRSDFIRHDRLGQKKNGGFYNYDANRKATASPEAAAIIADYARFRNVEQRAPRTADEILADLLYPVVNEGAKILEEGIALRASDIDVACILGYAWPVYTGGPMFWGDMVGLDKIVARLDEMAKVYGPAFEPAALLREKAASGGHFTR